MNACIQLQCEDQCLLDAWQQTSSSAVTKAEICEELFSRNTDKKSKAKIDVNVTWR